MSKRRGLAIGVLAAGAAISGCSGDGLEVTRSNEQSVVRASSVGGPDQVVMLYISVLDAQTGSISQRTCSGAYFAPRVVATAAHCLDSDPALAQQVVQVLSYFGDDFAADQAELTPYGAGFRVPAPGAPSNFAEADSYEVHPDWDRSLLYPDLGVVYLDRKLPFDPLPLARFRINRPWEGRAATISGWGGDEATSPSTATGAGVQRTGTTKILGSPTAADYHPDDPNPGMLRANVRNKVLKTDGRTPSANACFGDSGGPLLVNQFGQDYIAGISYFVGLSCEDYGLYTRIDPFLPFFDEAYRKGGQAPLVPALDCVAENADGSLTAFFGYTNENGVSITVPLGDRNSLPLDVGNHRTTLFQPGEHHFNFGVDFGPTETLLYTLSPENSPTTTLRVDANSRRCGPADQPAALCGQSCRAKLASGCSGLPSYGSCIEGCVGFYESFPEPAACLTFIDAWSQCIAALSPNPANWVCYGESSPGAGDGFADTPSCAPYIDQFFGCAFGG